MWQRRFKALKVDLNDGKGCCWAQTSNFTQECVEGIFSWREKMEEDLSASQKISLKIFT